MQFFWFIHETMLTKFLLRNFGKKMCLKKRKKINVV